MVAGCIAFVFLTAHSALSAAGADGRVHDLAAEAHGRPIALIFISHDCPICNAYAPEFTRIARDYRGRAVFALVYAEPAISGPAALSHAKNYRLMDAELLLDPEGRLATYCGARITPEAVVFDGAKRRQYVGRIDDLFYDFGKQRQSARRHDLRIALNAVLKHKPATPAAGPPFGCVIETGLK